MPGGTPPRFVSFDLHGTLIDFRIDETIREVLGDRLPADLVDDVEEAGNRYRFDECLGDWRPYHEIIDVALRRTLARFGLERREGDGRRVYDAIGTWGPYPDVPPVLQDLADHLPLVILTNSDDAQVVRNVERLGAPVHTLVTAEQARAYKPRLRALEHLLERLGVAPEEIVHVSSSPRYDHRPAAEVGIAHKIYLDRGWEPHQPWLGYRRITDVADLPDVMGLHQAGSDR